MSAIVIGLGIQGNKRLKFAGNDVVATVDPYVKEAVYKKVEDVPLELFDTALVCVPDNEKLKILNYLVKNRKHTLVEKPLVSIKDKNLLELKRLAEIKKTVCYTAYNHRHEPHIIRAKKIIDSGQLGKIYRCKFFYGNGTARDVRNSAWRDQGMGVFTDLGSHLLDWTLQLFGKPSAEPKVWSACCHENNSYDHFHFGFEGKIFLDYEISLLMWKNTFRFDLFAEKGSIHIDCLCKWGPSIFRYRKRKFPSGKPDEEIEKHESADMTWEKEYMHFKSLCSNPKNNISNDIWINKTFQNVKQQLL